MSTRRQAIEGKTPQQERQGSAWQGVPPAQAGGGAAQTCIAPLPQDRRFDDPAWQRWPCHLLYQGFLLQQHWWHRTTTGVRGVSPHHAEIVTCTVRHGDACIEADNWQRDTPHHDGSWWPAWQAWLAERSGPQTAPPSMSAALGNAPGSYMPQP